MSSPPLSPGASLLHTPLHAAHAARGAKLVPFAGWSMPLDYGSILKEARAVRSSAGIFDVSHMARFWFRGPDAAAELDRALGGATADQPVGKARYNLLLNERGTILDDLITYRTGPSEYFMVVNASNRERDRATLAARMQTTRLTDVTEDGGGILALQGPDSRQLLEQLSGQSGFCPRFLDLAQLPTPDLGPLFVARTGYTGEHGYELFVTPSQIQPVWERLLAAGAVAVGLGARDVLRLEAALPLYGHEIHEGVQPFEAGLGFAMKGWQTRDFVGAAALRAMPPSSRQLVGLRAEQRPPREGYPVLCAGQPVGLVCSGVWSAWLDQPIATAYVRSDAQGELSVDARGKNVPVQRVPLPFVSHRSRE
ncbi:MAG: glycine cleavage system aminomethyltransferase GcvT [Planctomycetota bacterium]|nr:MAG: glycine cleavage system aminomethyltransferase GcvT [Planctomycetota bacterium]